MAMAIALLIRVRGVVQGVGFRPFVYRLATENHLNGWVLNGEEGVQIHVEGIQDAIDLFLRDLKSKLPPAATISKIETQSIAASGFRDFTIRSSEHREHPTVRISPDLTVCDDCLRELFDSSNRRYQYPYINCTNCGPRYSVILSLPYDRCNTTMRDWRLDQYCDCEYRDPANRRFHAQPVACPECGPTYLLRENGSQRQGNSAITKAAILLQEGKILAVKGLGGYHLACDAHNPAAIAAMRERKFRKEKPFAIMVRDIEVAHTLIALTSETEALLVSVARPVVLAPAKTVLEEVAPENPELGVMLPYTPLHHLLFAAGAPDALVMTSANRSSEPIAYEDHHALESLAGIADGFLIGERPIARRVDDSVVRSGAFGPAILRRSRGYAPGAVASLPCDGPILAVGPDLKNTITLVVDRQAFVSQHIGDLSHYDALRAFRDTVQDLVTMYEVSWKDLLVVHDAHPQYASTVYALELPVKRRLAVQHHRAHIASVLAEHGAWQKRVLGVSFDGTGFGDDGSIWGGEIFVGSVASGFERVGHLRQGSLPGGDAAAQNPIQAAAGFLYQIADTPDFSSPPFSFSNRYQNSLELVKRNVRSFPTTSVGRLFDTAAALLGFTRPITYEGQAAIWLEQLARKSSISDAYPFPFFERELDFRPLLRKLIEDRMGGRDSAEIARAFQRGIAQGLCEAATQVSRECGVDTVVLSGGVFQNELLLEDLRSLFETTPLTIWTNRAVPANDGGISLGQAALASFAQPAMAK
jgi:hydrogenase maturation protein HypF